MPTRPRRPWPWVKTLMHRVDDQVDARAVSTQLDKVLDAVADSPPAVADHLETPRPDLLTFTPCSKAVRRQIWSNNPDERLNGEIGQRTNVVGDLP